MPRRADKPKFIGARVVTGRRLWQVGGMKLALILPLFLALALPLHADPAEDALREGLRLSRAEDYAGARAAVAGVGGVAADLVEWSRLRAGDEAARLGDYEAFLAKRPDWPGLGLLRQKGEVAVARSTDPARVPRQCLIGRRPCRLGYRSRYGRA